MTDWKSELLEEVKKRREELNDWLYGTIHKQYDTEETAETVKEDVDRYFSDEWIESWLSQALEKAEYNGVLIGIDWTMKNFKSIVISEDYGPEPTNGELADKALDQLQKEKL